MLFSNVHQLYVISYYNSFQFSILDMQFVKGCRQFKLFRQLKRANLWVLSPYILTIFWLIFICLVYFLTIKFWWYFWRILNLCFQKNLFFLRTVTSTAIYVQTKIATLYFKQLFHLHDKENDENNDPSNKTEKTKEESFGSSLAVHPPIASPLLRI